MPEDNDGKAETPGVPPAFDWDFCSIAELAKALRSRRISASELLDHVIARIEAMDQRINAVVVRDFDRAEWPPRRPIRPLPVAKRDRCSASPSR
jgi:amidase